MAEPFGLREAAHGIGCARASIDRKTQKMRLVPVCALAFSLTATAALAAYPGHPPTNPDIAGADISARDKAVADDAFEGRGPGSVNGEAAAQWIADELKR